MSTEGMLWACMLTEFALGIFMAWGLGTWLSLVPIAIGLMFGVGLIIHKNINRPTKGP